MNANQGGYLVYPSGFARRDTSFSGVRAEQPDEGISVHYLGLIQGTLPLNGREAFMANLDEAIRLLGNGTEWIVTQRHNPNLTKKQVQFVIDTVNYIRTGKRSMYPETWLALLERNEPLKIQSINPGSATAANPEIVVPSDLFGKEPSAVIARWISHDGGLSDMISALNIMFGGVPYVRGEPGPTL